MYVSGLFPTRFSNRNVVVHTSLLSRPVNPFLIFLKAVNDILSTLANENVFLLLV